MKFTSTAIGGVFLVELEPKGDDRGFFSRIYCSREFDSHGLTMPIAQGNLVFSLKKGTVRGLHYQVAPATESKLVRCIAGAIFDVLVDMRPESKTYLQWIGVELSAENRLALFVPSMIAHGYQCLKDNTEVLYLVDQFYAPGTEQGIRFSDAAVGIAWPLEPSQVAVRDTEWPLVKARNGRTTTEFREP